MLNIRPESEPAIRWARDVSDIIDEAAYQLFHARTRARVTLENCLEHLRVFGCDTNSPYAPVDVDKCETVLMHERGVMFVWNCRRAGQSTPWINGGLILTYPSSMSFIGFHPLSPPDVIRNQLLVSQPTELTLDSLTWSTHT